MRGNKRRKNENEGSEEGRQALTLSISFFISTRSYDSRFFIGFLLKMASFFINKFFKRAGMYQHWDSQQNSNLNNEIGSTAIMTSNPFDIHHNHQPSQPSSWFNNSAGIQIKAEPMDHFASPKSSSQMSPILPQNSADLLDPFRQLGVFNPLTPPGYSGLLFQSSFLNGNQHVNLKHQTTPSKPQDLSKNKEVESSITPPMDVTPPKSPTINDQQTPEKDDMTGLETHSESVESYDEDSDDYDDECGGGLLEGGDENKSKKRKGSNKPRQYKCKQCKQIFHAKTEFWDHTKAHIKPEKMLKCPKCPFVTEYKHHLEYHLRNHSRSKPFLCPHCNYSCVNKSMLNSHLKSHSTVLQYRCLDCNYATKYCHSLKLHLRKYDHKPDIVLNLDGTPNPLPIIDIYGTRRGPKSKATTEKLLAEIEKNQTQQAIVKAQAQQLSPPLTPSSTSTLALSTTTTNTITSTPPSSLLLPPNASHALMVNMLQNVGNKMPSLFPYFHLNLQMFAAHQQQKLQSEMESEMTAAEMMSEDVVGNKEEEEKTNEADSNFCHRQSEKRTKRKGKAFKFDEKLHQAHHSDDGEHLMEQEVNNLRQSEKVTSTASPAIADSSERSPEYECKFCGIIFKDNVLFSLHIGYHSLGDDPFKCNMCGMRTEDKVQFFLHIAKFPHS